MSERRRSRSPRAADRRSRSRSRSRKPRRSPSRSRSASPARGRRSRKSRHRSRSASASPSESSSSSSDASSSSSSDGERRRHRKTKKSERKKRSKSSHRKDKKSRKKKKESKKSSKSFRSSAAVNQNEYGKFGILRESDFHAKSVSFQAWLRDVKHVGDFNGPKWEAMELFKEYMEDYNTATMPHDKYYDIEKYEMRAHQKKLLKASRRTADEQLDAVADEERVRLERRRVREKKEQEDFRLVMQFMDKDKVEDMRHQEQLRTQMQLHYKSGNVAEARRLEQLLNKVDEVKR